MNWECEKCKILLPKIELNEIYGWGIYICTHCIEKFLQPERSKREDFDKLAKEFLNQIVSDRGGNWETENGYILGIKEYSSWLNQRCGALNTMET